MARQPDGPPPPPTVQKLRLRYTKRGPLRFASHRDLARALERALRRAQVPMAFSAGFSPHPKISYMGAAPTGAASEAEYVEIGLAVRCDPEAVRVALDASLPPGIDVLECVEAGEGTGGLAERLDGTRWRVDLAGVDPAELSAAVEQLLAAEVAMVAKRTKNGTKDVDVRAALVSASVSASVAGEAGRAILHVVVRQVTPTVRPDDVLAALAAVADLHPPVPPRAVREAQGRLDGTGEVTDPLEPDREAGSRCQGEPQPV